MSLDKECVEYQRLERVTGQWPIIASVCSLVGKARNERRKEKDKTMGKGRRVS